MAVYTEVSEIELAKFIGEYDIGARKSCEGITEGVENSNYLLTTEKGKFILTLYEKRVNFEDLPFFLGLMEHLAKTGLPCPTPIHDFDGKVLKQLCGKPAAITSFLDGVSPERLDNYHCAQVGTALAKLHLFGSNYKLKRRNSLSKGGWGKLFKESEQRADEVTAGLANLMREEIKHLEFNWPQNLPSGIIHADLFPDNVFFKNGHLTGLIDFYFACNDFLAYDLAVCINAWCFEPNYLFNTSKAQLMINAYCKERPLSEAEFIALPDLARGAAMRFLCTRLFDWLNIIEGALVKPKNPIEYIQKLKFHQQNDDISAFMIK